MSKLDGMVCLRNARSFRTFRSYRNVAGLVIVLFAHGLAGCSGGASIEVEADFPIPLVDRLPVRMGLFLKPELLEYAHREKLDQQGEFVITVGSAQRLMFTNLFTGMFQAHEEVAESAVEGVDGVIVPSIEEMQFAMPSQTRSNFYEVWIRYQFQLFDKQGTLVGEWPLTAYGKANAQNYTMQTTNLALERAALNACRDAMAFFTIQFRSNPIVKPWLATVSNDGSTT